MNGFIDVSEVQWEKNEERKAQLAQALMKQMDEAKARKEKAKQKQLEEEIAIEKKLEREREEIKVREAAEK